GDEPSVKDANLSFAGANPIPDGRTRERQLSLVDGVLVNQGTLVILFREHFESFLGETDDDGFSAYGVMLLRRGIADLAPDAFAGGTATDERTPASGVLGVSCNPDLLDAAIGTDTMPTSPSELDRLATVLINGFDPGSSSTPLDPADVHYYCEDTGLF